MIEYLRILGLIRRRDHTPQAHVGPNEGHIPVPTEEGLYLIEVGRFGFLFCKGNVDIVVDQHNHANFRRKIE